MNTTLNINQKEFMQESDILPRYIKNTTGKIFSNCYFKGLWEKRILKETEVMYTAFQGQKIYAKVVGANKITIDFLKLTSSSQIIAYKIDTNEFVRVSITEFPITISLPDALEHYIRIVIAGMANELQTYTNDTGCAFKSLVVDTGIVEPVSIKGRKFYVYGDSNAIGYIMLGSNAGTDNSAERTWAEQASKQLRADCVVTAISGIGVKASSDTYPPVIGSSIKEDYTVDSFIDSLRKGVRNELDSPDFIIINLGANDDSTKDNDFKIAYIKIIKRLQIKFPGIEIFVMCPIHGNKANVLRIISEELKLAYIDTSTWHFTYSSDNRHLDENGAYETGKNVAKFLMNYFGKAYFFK